MLSKKELKELVKKWQKLLRLQDWFIILKVVRDEDEKENEKRSGSVSIADMIFEAEIELNAKQFPGDAEITIVHELAHIQVNTAFKPLRELLEDMEPKDSELLEDILDICEEEQTRHIEFLVARMLKRGRYLPRLNKEKKCREC